jgi:endonuclease YncB( thermonuclease family)
MDAFIAERPVNCLPISLDRYGRTVATCSVGGLTSEIGWCAKCLALDWPEYSKRKYDAANRDADKPGGGYVRQLRRAVAISSVHPSERTPDRLFGRC